MSALRKEILTREHFLHELSDSAILQRSSRLLLAHDELQRAEIERLTKELAPEKEAQHVSWENYQISQEIERQRNEYALRVASEEKST